MANGMLGSANDFRQFLLNYKPVNTPETNPYYYGQMRQAMDPNDPMQSVIAPLEHREYARNFVNQGGPLAAPSLVTAIPAYTQLKAAALSPFGALPLPIQMIARALVQPDVSTSPASLDEMLAGYQGLFSGLRDKFYGNGSR